MKNVFLLCMLLLPAASRVFGQSNFNDSLALSRNGITQDAMLTLGGFAIANIASGFIAASGTHGETRYVWRMNGYWNLINLGVAGLGYMGLRKAMTRKYSLSGNEKAQLAIEKNVCPELRARPGLYYRGILPEGKGQCGDPSRIQGINSKDMEPVLFFRAHFCF
jgi:hypothetical protein